LVRKLVWADVPARIAMELSGTTLGISLTLTTS
jgi:hypothetical protein